MTARRLVITLVATTVLGVSMAHGSAARIPWYGTETSEFRLSWRAVPERIETCRALSVEELAARPAHMRQALECEGRSATYLLRVRIDDATVDSIVVRGGGARSDRPMFVLRQHAVAPGSHRVRVSFERVEQFERVERATDRDGDSARMAGVRTVDGRRAGAVPPLVTLDTLLTFESGMARFLILDRDRFVVREP